jgi:hypothetical protein
MADDDDEFAKALAQMREASDRARGYADFFEYQPDRAMGEVGVVESLEEVLENAGAGFFSSLQSRGRGNDPPDCEALNAAGQRIAIEVTELVSAGAIRASKAKGALLWQEWDRPTFLSSLANALIAKDSKHAKLKGGPYPGGYVVVLHTDELLLSREFVQAALEGSAISVQHISRAFLLLSYRSGRYPYFELPLCRDDF